MTRWKHCPSTTFESLPLSTCTLRQQKSYISKDIQPIFEIFASARRFWGWEFGLKVSGAHVFYCCNGKMRTLSIDKIWKFATLNLYTVPEKSYISKGIQPIFEIFASLEDVERGHLGGKFQVRRCFTFAMARWKLRASTTFEILPLSTCTLCQQKLYISKVFTRFSKSLPQLHDFEGGHLGGKFQERRYFCFAMARWKFSVSSKFESLPLSTCTLCQQKSYIYNGIHPIFEIIDSAARNWGRAFWCKVSGGQVFYFCNGKVKTLRIDNIWKFATFNMYTVPAKILYFQRYSTDFRNVCLSSKMLRVGIWVERFRREGILLLQWQGENIAHRQHLKVCHFQPVHCASKNPISPRYSTDFRNLCLSSKLLRVGISVESFRCVGILLLQWQGENFAYRQHLKVCHFQPVHCARKNPISPRVFNRFSKS